MEILKIAWRNIWRNKTRSMVVILAVTFGMFGGGFSTALMLGAVNQRVEKAIGNESSHMQVHQPDFLTNPTIENTINNSDILLEKYESQDFVKKAVGRLKVTAMIQSAHNTSGTMISGIKPESEKILSDIPENIEKGSYFGKETRNQIVISQRTAEKLKLDVRSKLVLTFQDKYGNLTGGAFRVVGIYHTSNQMFDEMNVFVLKSDLMRITGFTSHQSHEIAMLFTDNDDLAERKAVISGVTDDDLEVKSWKELNPDLDMMTMMTEKYLSYLVGIILFALAFGIINTMLMAILERRKELGMLMAVGMTQGKIRRMIVWETIFLTALGSALGLLINQGLVSYLGEKGLDLAAYAQGMESFGFESVVYPSINGTFYLQIVALVILTALIASIFPIIRAGKMKPAEVLSSN